ncbi:MAG: Zn-dependent oligopeptidase [Halioglobus sp.]|nr:Zn-dependent oligopeptidase [Halioglobus sp.]
MGKFISGSSIAILLCLAVGNFAYADSGASRARDGWEFNESAAQFTALCDSVLADAQAAFSAIERDSTPASLQRVFGAYDAMMIDLQRIEHAWYMKAVHPDPQVQTAAEQCVGRYTDFLAAVNLSPAFYRRVAAIELEDASESEKFMVEKKLRAFRLAGVDRDEATRKKVRALMTEITRLGSKFEKEIRLDKRSVETTTEQLAGLPQDFLASHPPDERDVILVSTDYADYLPIMKYGRNDDLRYRLFKAAKTVATPANSATLKALVTRRHELAVLLGYETYAALAMDGLMAATPQTVQGFLTQLDTAVKKPAGRDVAAMLARLREIDPTAEQVQAWQVYRLENLIRQEDFALDTREIRTYFHYDRVQAGIFGLTEDLFGVEIVPWHTSTWHPDVTAWEIREHDKPIGRFYLDMHPRDNKYGHAAHWALRRGLKDGQLPLSGMATNFPQGLMEHRQVESFLHEFGHLLHNMFSGTQQWFDISGMSMERDFVEAPSQMLEQWAWNYETLREFAIDTKGRTIPAQLVERMNAARHFGEAANTAAQIFYANLALHYHNRDPDSFELLPLLMELQAQYSPYPYVEDTHFYNNFRHLNGYASNYYTYQWSQAISIDLFSRFQRDGLRDTATARAYREKILAPAGSKPAAQLVEDFLGRPFSPATYRQYLNELN